MIDFRVVRRNRELAVHEVYYDEGGRPSACTTGPIAPRVATLDDLRYALERMLDALDEPILDYEEITIPG